MLKPSISLRKVEIYPIISEISTAFFAEVYIDGKYCGNATGIGLAQPVKIMPREADPAAANAIETADRFLRENERRTNDEGEYFISLAGLIREKVEQLKGKKNAS